MVYLALFPGNVSHLLNIAAKRLRTVLRWRAWLPLHMDTIHNAIVEHESTSRFACQHQYRPPARRAELSESFANEFGKAGVSTV
jgi:hypothetical protein